MVWTFPSWTMEDCGGRSLSDLMGVLCSPNKNQSGPSKQKGQAGPDHKLQLIYTSTADTTAAWGRDKIMADPSWRQLGPPQTLTHKHTHKISRTCEPRLLRHHLSEVQREKWITKIFYIIEADWVYYSQLNVVFVSLHLLSGEGILRRKSGQV